jgi:transposase
MVKVKNDSKQDALSEQASLNPRPGDVSDPLFDSSEFFDSRDLMQVKYEMVRRVKVDGKSIAESAASFGFSRPSYYQIQAAIDEEGIPGLLPQQRGPRRAHKLNEQAMDFLTKILTEEPDLRSSDLADRLKTEFGLKVHSRSIERALGRKKKL